MIYMDACQKGSPVMTPCVSLRFEFWGETADKVDAV